MIERDKESITPGRNQSVATTIVIAITVVILLGLAYVSLRPKQRVRNNLVRREIKNRDASLSPADARKVVERKNIANGYLENADYRMAEQELSALAELLRHELLPARNLAIARVLRLESLGTASAADRDPRQLEPPDAQAGAKQAEPQDDMPLEDVREAALEAIERLKLLEPKSAVPYWLLARVLQNERTRLTDATERDANLRATLENLAQAAKLEPKDPAIHYALFREASGSATARDRQSAKRALTLAHELQPQNVAILRALLQALAADEDTAIYETLEVAEPVFQQLQSAVPQFNMADFLEGARAAATNGDWRGVVTNIRSLDNVSKGTPRAKSDLKLLEPHPLVFVLYEFSPEFYLLNPPAPLPTSPAKINVVLRRADQQLPPLDDVQDLALTDFDLDGLLDVAVLRASLVEIYYRPGVAEQPWALLASHPVPAGMQHIITADLHQVDEPTRPRRPTEDTGEAPIAADQTPGAAAGKRVKTNGQDCHDTYMGFIVYGPPGIAVVKNLGPGDGGHVDFEDVPQTAALQALRGVTAVTTADLDHDGDLDLAIAAAAGVTLWSNKNHYNFEYFSEFPSLVPAESAITKIVAADWDRDVDIDLLATGSVEDAAGLFEDVLHQQFVWRPFGRDLAALAPAQDLDLLDADGNISWDLVACTPDGIRLVQTVAPEPGPVVPMEQQLLTTQAYDGLEVWDFDNDSVLDLLCWSGDRIDVLRGSAAAAKADPFGSSEAEWSVKIAPDVIERPPAGVRRTRVADLDGDGDVEMAVVSAEGVVLFTNDGGNENHWLQLRIRGADDETASGRVNHYAIGSLIEIRTAARYQAQVVTSPTTHFGLGGVEQADAARLVLTNGIPQAVITPEANQLICEPMILKGSCPYVYTWDGAGFEFYTDLLWAAPLGLQFAPGQLAPSRAWEYLKLDGDALEPRENHYELRITEELWEAGYFDQVELIAVDHPADVEIFTNEKVGPPELAAPHIYTVREARPPRAARNARGQDVLHLVRTRDGQYMKGFERQFRQGLVEEHFLELDLGTLADYERLTLFLTGWIYPTDTSLNFAIAEDPELEAPRPPALWVPNTEGDWVEVRPFMGFPGGKTKTIAIDLSDVFPTSDHRLRIVTSAQIYWDEAFFTFDEEPVEVREQPLMLASADLRYRGFSALLPRQPNAPDRYDYERATIEPKWPPMAGRFTRYGDVRTLLTEQDDKMVILGAGDEIALRFKMPARELPQGWKRDFILHNVGWDKDADLNTIYGQTVEPLPFNSMTSYPYPPDESYPNDAEHQRYLETYQTREQRPRDYWRLMGK